MATGLAATDTADGLKVFLLPGVTNGAILDRFELRHRLVGAGTWEPLLDVPAATAMFDLTGLYAIDDDVQLEARAVSIDGQQSAFTATVTVTVGALDGAAPAALAAGAVTVENGTGAFTIVVDTSLADAATARVRLFVNDGGVLDEADDFVGSVAADGTEYRRVRNLPAGSYQVFARPVNALGAAGPVFGPVPATSS